MANMANMQILHLSCAPTWAKNLSVCQGFIEGCVGRTGHACWQTAAEHQRDSEEWARSRPKASRAIIWQAGPNIRKHSYSDPVAIRPIDWKNFTSFNSLHSETWKTCIMATNVPAGFSWGTWDLTKRDCWGVPVTAILDMKKAWSVLWNDSSLVRFRHSKWFG